MSVFFQELICYIIENREKRSFPQINGLLQDRYRSIMYETILRLHFLKGICTTQDHIYYNQTILLKFRTFSHLSSSIFGFDAFKMRSNLACEKRFFGGFSILKRIMKAFLRKLL